MALHDSLIALQVRRPRRIQIASPCPENWESMFGDEKVRHCEKCQLNVFNLSEMSRDEAEMILARYGSDGLCVRYYQRDDGKVMFKDCPDGERQAAHKRGEVLTGRYDSTIGRR